MRPSRNEFGAAVMALALLIATAGPFVTNVGAAGMDGVVMYHGAGMLMKQGQPMMRLVQPINLTDGSRVTPDGIIIRSDGSEIRLRNGEMVMMDGHIMRGGKARAMEKRD